MFASATIKVSQSIRFGRLFQNPLFREWNREINFIGFKYKKKSV